MNPPSRPGRFSANVRRVLEAATAGQRACVVVPSRAHKVQWEHALGGAAVEVIVLPDAPPHESNAHWVKNALAQEGVEPGEVV